MEPPKSAETNTSPRTSGGGASLASESKNSNWDFMMSSGRGANIATVTTALWAARKKNRNSFLLVSVAVAISYLGKRSCNHQKQLPQPHITGYLYFSHSTYSKSEQDSLSMSHIKRKNNV